MNASGKRILTIGADAGAERLRHVATTQRDTKRHLQIGRLAGMVSIA